MARMMTPMRSKGAALRRELKQARRFSGPAEESSVALLRTADVIRGEIERVLGEHGVTLQQYNVLRILKGSHPEPIATLEIADRMIERAPGITRLLDRLEAAGQVRRERCKEDRRRVLCHITDAGLATLEQTTEPVRAAQRRRASRLSQGDLARLLELLERLRGDVT